MKKGMLNKAIAQYKKAIIINPSDVKAHNNLATIYLNNGMLDAAISHFEKALTICHPSVTPDVIKYYNDQEKEMKSYKTKYYGSFSQEFQ